MTNMHKIGLQEFIEKAFIQESEQLIKYELYQSAFLVMLQGIEILGSFLDNKPMKAVSQSKLRFSHAINRLMPASYRNLNNNHWLYDSLRTSFVHTFTPSSFLILSHRTNKEFGKKHLQKSGEKLILIAEDFQEDFAKACRRLIVGMEKGFVPAKKQNALYDYPF